MRSSPQESFASGRLERLLQSGCFRGSGAASGNLSQCLRSVLEAVSNCDRRIGLLSATITEVQRCIRERDLQAAGLEAELAAARQERQSLDEELDREKDALDQAEAAAARLQESRRKLAHEIDSETMKQRHAAVDVDGGLLSVWSETSSTVCTQCDHVPWQLTRDPGLPPLVGSRS